MKIGLDIGGVISKYPQEFRDFLNNLNAEFYVISDMHPKSEILKVLQDNDFLDKVKEENIYSADYEKYGNFAKAILIKELGIQMFIDDFDGYLQWDSSFGPQPILLKVQPDGFKSYWHDDWKCDGGEFGRRKYLLSGTPLVA